MNILDKIVAQKSIEVATSKDLVSTTELEKSLYFNRKVLSTKANLLSAPVGIIAEHKRKSPSKGVINDTLSVAYITQGYSLAGASCLSVLTDSVFFGGSKEDLLQARAANPNTPILRKDFMIDEYQILEAKSWGADVILLIAANLTPDKLMNLAKFAKTLGLETLLEVHDKEEMLANINPFIDLVGVNNRNLKSFEVSLQTSLDLAELIPTSFVKIAESGINTASEVKMLQKAGFSGFLIGESFMRTTDPGKACANLMQEVKDLK